MPQLEVWFQRASDVVRKLSYGDFDLGIVGLDMFAELSHGDPDLVVVHDALDFGHCHLGLGVPMGGKFADISTLDQLRSMPEWSESNPLRVVTGYQNVARKFFQEQGFEHVVLLSADGALEAAPLMGSADIILDLVSTGDHLAKFFGRVEPVLYRFSHSLLINGYALSTTISDISHMLHWSVATYMPLTFGPTSLALCRGCIPWNSLENSQSSTDFQQALCLNRSIFISCEVQG